MKGKKQKNKKTKKQKKKTKKLGGEAYTGEIWLLYSVPCIQFMNTEQKSLERAATSGSAHRPRTRGNTPPFLTEMENGTFRSEYMKLGALAGGKPVTSCCPAFSAQCCRRRGQTKSGWSAKMQADFRGLSHVWIGMGRTLIIRVGAVDGTGMHRWFKF
ncbi:hypothetical protein I7I48_09064 [Histoplasma ohiense]|nr:hypothetical protein I7I48_09064 [Histoplasma ohiense (nom. inval.)]